jgi:signal transduction histidine kinase/CheY-like chemotaxis protein
MLDNIVGKYAASEFLSDEEHPSAILDSKLKFVWFNKKFREVSGIKLLKGKYFPDLFSGINEKDFRSIKQSKFHSFSIPNKFGIDIKPLKGRGIEGYLLKIKCKSNGNGREDSELVHSNLLFQAELQNVLTLLVKERSLDVLSEEILLRCISVSKSAFGAIVFLEDNKKFNFLFLDTQDVIKSKQDAEREIKLNFSFISKWLQLNKKPLLALNTPDNIGFHLTQLFQSDYLILSPCFFDSELLAVIITGKRKEKYSLPDINNLEQLSSLLAFAISSTRVRELNANLENRLLQAQKLETIGKLTSGMAHDFSNLLSSIFGSLNLLRKRVPSTDDVSRLIDNIESCSIRAKDLTKGLLSFGKPTPKRKELINPNTLLSEMSKVIIQTFPKSITFETYVENDLSDILGNSTEIYQVLLNLCVNAKEAIEEKGKIVLSGTNITIDDKNVFKYPLLAKGNYVRFCVQDNGAGIKEEHLQKIFDPYFSTKEKETGSGLGLYVAYGIIKAHQGHIEVSSRENEGTTFEVFIPSFEPAHFEKAAFSNKIILLADDEIMLRDLLAELLESSDYSVIRVQSGLEVLKVLTEEIKVDLLIIDYNMPEMNGIDCLKKVKELGLPLRVILSSGSLSFADDLDLKELGVNSVLTKPYEFDTMLSTIQKLI